MELDEGILRAGRVCELFWVLVIKTSELMHTG